MPELDLTPEQLEALKEMVGGWIWEGSTIPPYSDAQYDVFETLDMDEDDPYSYDTRRPTTVDP